MAGTPIIAQGSFDNYNARYVARDDGSRFNDQARNNHSHIRRDRVRGDRAISTTVKLHAPPHLMGLVLVLLANPLES